MRTVTNQRLIGKANIEEDDAAFDELNAAHETLAEDTNILAFLHESALFQHQLSILGSEWGWKQLLRRE